MSSSDSDEILTSSNILETHKRMSVHLLSLLILYSSEDFLMPVMDKNKQVRKLLPFIEWTKQQNAEVSPLLNACVFICQLMK
jgi:hypothetical protein